MNHSTGTKKKYTLMIDISHHLKDFMHFPHLIQWFSDYHLPMSSSDKGKLNWRFQCFAFFSARPQDLICNLPK